ncbi:hypothetical protein LEMLEM_LOCUS18339, partial [Lemmus lemmus]
MLGGMWERKKILEHLISEDKPSKYTWICGLLSHHRNVSLCSSPQKN